MGPRWRYVVAAILAASLLEVEGLAFLIRRPGVLLPLVPLVLVFAGLLWLAVRRPRPRPEPGVEFIGESAGGFPLRAGARCLVCRMLLGGDVIYCAGCRTPHHIECFAWAGACSVYACRDRRYRRPEAA